MILKFLKGHSCRYIMAMATVSLAVSAVLTINTQNSQARDSVIKGFGGQLIAAKKDTMTTSDPVVVMDTSKGTIKMQIYKKDAPITSGNFIDLVQKGFYNGLTFHRYEPGFVIQGGDPKGDGTGGYIDPKTHQERRVPLEIKPNLRHGSAGMLAMARSSDPNSASCQFYITLAPASFLDNNYAVFGKVVDGLDAALNLRKGDKIVKAIVQEPVTK